MRRRLTGWLWASVLLLVAMLAVGPAGGAAALRTGTVAETSLTSMVEDSTLLQEASALRTNSLKAQRKGGHKGGKKAQRTGVSDKCRNDILTPHGFRLCVPKCLKKWLPSGSPLKKSTVPACQKGKVPCQTKYTEGALQLPAGVRFMPCRDMCSGGYGSPAVCHPPELKGSKILKGMKLKKCPPCVSMCLTKKLRKKLVDPQLFKGIAPCPHRGNIRSFCIPHAFRMFKWAFKGKKMTKVCPNGVTGCLPKEIKKGVKMPKGADMPACTRQKCRFQKLMPCLHRDYQFMKWPSPLSGFPPCKACQQMCVPRKHIKKFAKLKLPTGLKIKACPDYKEMKAVLKKALDPRGQAKMKEAQAKNRQSSAMAAKRLRQKHRDRRRKRAKSGRQWSQSEAQDRKWNKKGKAARRWYRRREKVMKEAAKEKIIKAKRNFKHKFGGLPKGMDKPIVTKVRIGVTAVPTCKNCPWFGSVVNPTEEKPAESDASLKALANTGSSGKQDKIRAAQAAAVLKEKANVQSPMQVAKALASDSQKASQVVVKKAQAILDANPFGDGRTAQERQLNREAYAFYKDILSGKYKKGKKGRKQRRKGKRSRKTRKRMKTTGSAGKLGRPQPKASGPVSIPNNVPQEQRTMPLPPSVQKAEKIMSLVNHVVKGKPPTDQPLSVTKQALAVADSQLMANKGGSKIDFVNNPGLAPSLRVTTKFGAHGKPQYRRNIEIVKVNVEGKKDDKEIDV